MDRRTLRQMTFRVAVTTSTDRASGMAAELVAVGLSPIGLPCIEVRVSSPIDLARARAAAEDADLMVLASSRPLDLLWPDGSIPDTPVAAARLSTASSVAQRGGVVEIVGAGSTFDLARQLEELVRERNLAFPHASTTDPRAIVTLADAAASCVAVSVYSSASMPPAHTPVDAVVFQSAAAVHGWALSRTFDDVLVACHGRSTRGALTDHARDPDVFVTSGSYAELAEGLAAIF